MPEPGAAKVARRVPRGVALSNESCLLYQLLAFSFVSRSLITRAHTNIA